MHKQIANKILSFLDNSADHIEKLKVAGKIDPKVAAEIVRDLDSFSDRLESKAFGDQSFRNRKAKVLQQDSDEKYMKTFDNTAAPLQTDADEKFMHKTDPSFNNKAMDTFDQDPSSTVTDRDEFAVRDLSEYSDGTKKQPSWTKGPAGKSTKQGSSAPSGKTWAP